MMIRAVEELKGTVPHELSSSAYVDVLNKKQSHFLSGHNDTILENTFNRLKNKKINRIFLYYA